MTKLTIWHRDDVRFSVWCFSLSSILSPIFILHVALPPVWYLPPLVFRYPLFISLYLFLHVDFSSPPFLCCRFVLSRCAWWRFGGSLLSSSRQTHSINPPKETKGISQGQRFVLINSSYKILSINCLHRILTIWWPVSLVDDQENSVRTQIDP